MRWNKTITIHDAHQDGFISDCLKNQIEKTNNDIIYDDAGQRNDYKLGSVPTSPVTDFSQIKTCCDAASWMIYYLFRDGGNFNNNEETYTKSIPYYKNLVLKKKINNDDGTYSYVFAATRDGEKVSYGSDIKNDDNGEIKGEGTNYYHPYAFLPVDGLGFEKNENEENKIENNYDTINEKYHNFEYTLESNGKFVYHKDQNLYFSFKGDDDVYLFINRQLVLDIGGTHEPESDTIRLEDLVSEGSTQTWAEYLELLEVLKNAEII